MYTYIFQSLSPRSDGLPSPTLDQAVNGLRLACGHGTMGLESDEAEAARLFFFREDMGERMEKWRMEQHMGVSLNGGFSPQIIHWKLGFSIINPSILEYHHFRKHPNILTS